MSTYVLMHGAWHGGWSWNAVAVALRAEGHEVHQPTAPGLWPGAKRDGVGLGDVVDHLVSTIEQGDLRDVVLVGHSWGGMVLSGAAPRLTDRLARLVYFSAFVPLNGESLYDLSPAAMQVFLDQTAAASGDNSVSLPFEVWQGLIQDAEPETQRILHGLMVPHPYATFADAVGAIEYGSLGVPQSYITSAEDLSMPPGEFAWAPRFPERLHDARVVETVGSHESLFTRPQEIAQAIISAS